MENVKISNFRKIQDSWDLDLAPITFFTGTNNSGKSNIFKALLLLEDYVESNNHFELDFNGKNSRKHKIDCYSNALNNFNKKNLDLKFQYSNRDHEIILHFKPFEIKDNVVNRGRLESLNITREDGAFLSLQHTGGLNYLLKLDSLFLERNQDKNEDNNFLKNQVLARTIENLMVDDLKTKGNLERQFIKLQKEIERLNVEISSNETNSSTKSNTEKIAQLDKKESSSKEIQIKIISINQEISDAKKKLKSVNKLLSETKTSNKNSVVFMPEFSLSEFQTNNLTIDRVIRRVLPKYFRENENEFGLFDERKEFSKLLSLSDKIMAALSFTVDHLSPQRNNQTRLYINSNTSSDINELIKEHSVKPINKKSKAGVFLKKWMNEFDIGEDFRISPIEGVATKIEILENTTWINLVDKGFGAGQIFSILLKIALDIEYTRNDSNIRFRLLRRPATLILIEEPEANLHPALQSKLADLFLDAFNEFDIRFIIETHSEYLIRQSLYINVKPPINNKSAHPFGLYYFQKQGEPYVMNYLENGKFDKPFGSGFFNVADELAMNTYRVNQKSK